MPLGSGFTGAPELGADVLRKLQTSLRAGRVSMPAGTSERNRRVRDSGGRNSPSRG